MTYLFHCNRFPILYISSFAILLLGPGLVALQNRKGVEIMETIQSETSYFVHASLKYLNRHRARAIQPIASSSS